MKRTMVMPPLFKQENRLTSLFCRLLTSLVVIVCLHAVTWPPAPVQAGEIARPRIGLVLSGGGARGAAHVGVIQVLESLRIPIDYIAGTSMGSIVGGLYASGMTVSEIEEIITSLDWRAALQDNIPRNSRSFRRKSEDRDYLINSKPGLSDDLEIKLPSGILQGQRVDLILKRLTLPVRGITDFDEFKIPFRAVATDIVTGRPVIIGSGDLATAMRASMSIPAVFSPVDIDGRLLVDGGVSNNMPVDVVRKMGADIVIAVDISTPLSQRDELKQAVSITQQLTKILTRRNTEEQIATLTRKDVLIIPDLGDIGSSSFDRADEAIPIGVTAALKMKTDLSTLSLSLKDDTAYPSSGQTGLVTAKPAPPVIEFLRLDNRSRLNDRVFLDGLKIRTGDLLNIAELEENISQLYGLELFENISYEIVEENGQTGLVVHVRERSWGPNYVQAGITMSGSQEGDHFFNLGLSYSRTAINRLNGEWRSAIQLGASPGLFTEIYQPLDYRSHYFVNPRLLYSKKTLNMYDPDGNTLGEYDLTQYGGDVSLGRELGTWGECRMGIRRITGKAEIVKGMTNQPDYHFEKSEVYTRLSADTLDNIGFPRNGYSGFIEYIRSEKKLGADNSFDQLLFKADKAVSFGPNTLIAGAKLFTTVDDDAPIQNRFDLGGLFNLSGYQKNELSGRHLALARLIYMRRINDLNLFPTYLGLSGELGNVWEEKSRMDFHDTIFAGSIFLGVDTFLGPVYLGYGASEKGHSSMYFNLGRLF